MNMRKVFKHYKRGSKKGGQRYIVKSGLHPFRKGLKRVPGTAYFLIPPKNDFVREPEPIPVKVVDFEKYGKRRKIWK
jgi:hypothetical protein